MAVISALAQQLGWQRHEESRDCLEARARLCSGAGPERGTPSACGSAPWDGSCPQGGRGGLAGAMVGGCGAGLLHPLPQGWAVRGSHEGIPAPSPLLRPGPRCFLGAARAGAGGRRVGWWPPALRAPGRSKGSGSAGSGKGPGPGQLRVPTAASPLPASQCPPSIPRAPPAPHSPVS